MYYIWYVNNEDLNTFYYLTKGSDIEALWKMMCSFWNVRWNTLWSSEGKRIFNQAKRTKWTFYGFYSFTPYSFLIEYIGD